jgi:hypothetical protein
MWVWPCILVCVHLSLHVYVRMSAFHAQSCMYTWVCSCPHLCVNMSCKTQRDHAYTHMYTSACLPYQNYRAWAASQQFLTLLPCEWQGQQEQQGQAEEVRLVLDCSVLCSCPEILCPLILCCIQGRPQVLSIHNLLVTVFFHESDSVVVLVTHRCMHIGAIMPTRACTQMGYHAHAHERTAYIRTKAQ